MPDNKKGGVSVYLISGIVIGLGILYLIYGGDSSAPQPPTAQNEPARKGVKTNFVPPKIPEKVITEQITIIKRTTRASSPADEVAIKTLAEARELYRLADEQSGSMRNNYFAHIKSLCTQIAEQSGVSDHIKQEANQLRYSAMKGTTLEAADR